MSKHDAKPIPPVMPHKPLREIAPDLFLAPSTIDVAPLMRSLLQQRRPGIGPFYIRVAVGLDGSGMVLVEQGLQEECD